MKLLVLAPITKDNWQKEENKQNSNIMDFYLRYQKENKIPFDMEIEFLKGQNLACADVFYSRPAYYYNEAILSELKDSISHQDILGIIIDPILTLQEEESAVCHRVEGYLAQEIYNQFSQEVPIYWLIQSGCQSFHDSELFQKSVDFFHKKGYMGFPTIHDLEYDLELSYQKMINYFLDFYYAKQENSQDDTNRKEHGKVLVK